MPKSAIRWFVLAVAIVAADQLVKAIVLGAFEPGERRALAGFFNLVLVFNKGAAFSFLSSASGWQTPLFAGFALLASVVVSALILKNPGRRMLCAGLALVLGGAVGNLIDRVLAGKVVDFLLFHWETHSFPAFNLADSALTLGVILFILDEFRRVNK